MGAAVGDGEKVIVAVADGVRVGVAWGVDAFGVAAINGDAALVAVAVASRFFSGDAVSVGLAFAVAVAVPIGVGVGVAVGVEVAVAVAVWVAVAVAVAVCVGVGVGVGVGNSHRGGHST